MKSFYVQEKSSGDNVQVNFVAETKDPIQFLSAILKQPLDFHDGKISTQMPEISFTQPQEGV